MRTAQEWAANWVAGMTNANDRIRAGVNRVTRSPGEAAGAALAKMRANWLAAVDGGRWLGAVNSFTVDQWKAAMINKGLPRIADGVRAAQGKVLNYAQRAIPIMTQLQDRVKAMPKITPQDSEARVLAWMRGMRDAVRQIRVGQ